MIYTITFCEESNKKLVDHLFQRPKAEQAAYLLCRISRTEREIRLLVKEVIPVSEGELIIQKQDFLSIPSSSYMPVMKKAAEGGCSFVLVHSHPPEFTNYSRTDDEWEKRIFQVAYSRAENTIHGSLVFSGREMIAGRMWFEDDIGLRCEAISRVRILGARYRIIKTVNANKEKVLPEKFFDRQVRAFGKELQKLMGTMNIGVVGCGGTGSAVIEQLARLGVGKLTIMDHDRIEDTNLTRIHGSKMSDVGTSKVSVMEAMVEGIGFGTRVDSLTEKIIYRSVAEKLKECDLIFGCTDDHAGRAILNAIAIRYLIPVIDMGVIINSIAGKIRNIPGRINIVKPGGACLMCLNEFDSQRVAAELMVKSIYEERRNEGYAPELGIPDPSVIPFTTAIAAQAVMEMLHLLVGYMGNEEDTERILWLFDQRKFRMPTINQSTNCMCTCDSVVGSGDMEPFLGMMWPARAEGE